LTPPTPPDFPRGRISGYVFGDLYYNTVGGPTHSYTIAGADQGQTNIDAVKPITRDLNGTQIRRVYFQLDNDLSIRYATRLRLEVDSKALTSDGKIGAYVKNAYFQAKSAIPRGDFLVGMINTPTFDNAEEFWQYRSIEKTIADFRGIASSSDVGVELKGYVDGNHRLGYAAMIGDGNGQKPETDRFKRLYFSIPVRIGDFRFEPYGDYQSVRVNLQAKVASHTDSLAVNNDQATWKAFAGYEFRRVAIGVEGLVRVNHQGPGATREPRGASVFARGTLTPTVAAFARFDHWQPDHRATDRVDSRLWIAGVDWQPFKDVHIMPNVEATQYLARGAATAPSHHDLQARVTFYCRFSRPQS
ncbi:MAG: hypothetical protein AUI33_10355, partial [Ignavibacteria bacterium 13_1_40CM_2_61_4]